MLPWLSATHFISKYSKAALFALGIVALLLKGDSIFSTVAYFSAHNEAIGSIQTGEWIPEVRIEITDRDDDDDDHEKDCRDKKHEESDDNHGKCDDEREDNDKEKKKQEDDEQMYLGDRGKIEDMKKNHDNDDQQEEDRDDEENHEDDDDDSDKRDDEWDDKKKRNSLCIRLFASLPDTIIYYEFSDDGDPIDGGKAYDDETKCLAIPKGSRLLQAQAVREQNEDWKSDVKTIDVVLGDTHIDHKY